MKYIKLTFERGEHDHDSAFTVKTCALLSSGRHGAGCKFDPACLLFHT
jgi:hypothetical protein